MVDSLRQDVKLHNSIILLKSASCIPGSPSHLRSIHTPQKFEILFTILHDHLASIVGPMDNEANKDLRVLIVVNGSKDLEVTTRMIKARFAELYPDECAKKAIDNYLVAGLEGHADIVEFSKDWKEAFDSHLILITSSQSMLYLFSYGLVRMDQLSHLVFDDCTMANSNHPFCVTMKSFYLPEMAKHLAKGGEGASSGLPRIIGFADWPLVSGEETFMVKRDRMAKMLDFVRLYQSVVCPVRDAIEAPAEYSWMSESDIAGLKEGGCFGQLRMIYLKKEEAVNGLLSRLEAAVEAMVKGPKPRGNVLFLVKPENIQTVQHHLRSLLKKYKLDLSCSLLSESSMMPSATNRVLLCRMDEIVLLCKFLQNQSMASLDSVYMIEPGVDVESMLTLLAFTEGQTPLVSVRGAGEVVDQATAMSVWMMAIGASSPVDSLPFRRLRSFIGGYEAIARSAFLLQESSPVHRRILKTGAMIFWNVSVQMLLCFCSYLPHIQSKGTGLLIHTMAVKRVNEAGKELDVERHFYMTRIAFPPCLAPLIPADRMQICGSLTPSRFSSQTTAAKVALETLYECGCLTDNLIIAPAVLALNEDEGHPRELEVNPFDVITDDGGVDGSDLKQQPEDIKEIVPEAFQKDQLWASLDESPNPPVEKSPKEKFYFYLFKYDIGMRHQNSSDDELKSRKEAQKTLKPISTGSDERTILLEEDKLPADTLVHLLDDNVFSTAKGNRTWCLVTRKPLMEGLKPVEIQIGATVLLKGVVEPLNEDGGEEELDEAQVKILKALQAIVFGCVNIKPLLMPSLSTLAAEDNEEDDAGGKQKQATIPWDKQVFYFVALAKRSGNTADLPPTDVTDLERSFELYKEFYGMLGKSLKSLWEEDKKLTNISDRWELDWEVMSKMVTPSARVNLLDYIEKVKGFEAAHKAQIEALGPPPVFDLPNDPTREPLVMDFLKFCLRRCIAYAPYNGHFYRVRGMHQGVTAGSPFETRMLPECKTYADFLLIKYGLTTVHPEAELVRFKGVDSFGSLSKWLQHSSPSNAKRRQRTISGGNAGGSGAGECRPALIPEWIEIIPVPYAIIQMAILLPRAIHDVDRQCLIGEFYQNYLPAFLPADSSSRTLPPTSVLVQSMTGPTASLSYDYERFEILGDCLLKLLTSIDVFLRCPNNGEGKLSSIRQNTICNTNLYKVAARLELYRFARLTPFFGKLWCPPDIRSTFGEELVARFPFIEYLFDEGQGRWALIAQANERAEKRSALYHLCPDGSLIDRGKAAGERIPLAGTTRHNRHKSTDASTPVLSRFGHPIPPKCFADLVESIIGAMFIGAGYPGGVDICRAFGLVTDAMLEYRQIDPERVLGSILGESNPEALISHPIFSSISNNNNQQQQISRGSILQGQSAIFSDVPPYQPAESDFPYEEVESILGYRFKHRRLLFVAMTHASVDVTNSNERLEWLGDAALDWAITRYYYDTFDDAKWMTPARITVTRQAAVCNEAFSRIAVQHGLHRRLRINSPHLQLEIEAYVRAVQNQMDAEAMEEEPAFPINWNASYAAGLAIPTSDLDDGPMDETRPGKVKSQSSSIPPAPKAIGDLFEGLAGAVFIDLSFDIDAFSSIYLPLIKWYLNRHADPYDLPENPISDFWHDYLSAGVPPSAIEFRYPDAEEIQRKLVKTDPDQACPPHLATCQILVRGRVIAEAAAPNRVLARKFATRQAVIYIRSSGWRDFIA